MRTTDLSTLNETRPRSMASIVWGDEFTAAAIRFSRHMLLICLIGVALPCLPQSENLFACPKCGADDSFLCGCWDIKNDDASSQCSSAKGALAAAVEAGTVWVEKNGRKVSKEEALKFISAMGCGEAMEAAKKFTAWGTDNQPAGRESGSDSPSTDAGARDGAAGTGVSSNPGEKAIAAFQNWIDSLKNGKAPSTTNGPHALGSAQSPTNPAPNTNLASGGPTKAQSKAGDRDFEALKKQVDQAFQQLRDQSTSARAEEAQRTENRLHADERERDIRQASDWQYRRAKDGEVSPMIGLQFATPENEKNPIYASFGVNKTKQEQYESALKIAQNYGRPVVLVVNDTSGLITDGIRATFDKFVPWGFESEPSAGSWTEVALGRVVRGETFDGVCHSQGGVNLQNGIIRAVAGLDSAVDKGIISKVQRDDMVQRIRIKSTGEYAPADKWPAGVKVNHINNPDDPIAWAGGHTDWWSKYGQGLYGPNYDGKNEMFVGHSFDNSYIPKLGNTWP